MGYYNNIVVQGIFNVYISLVTGAGHRALIPADSEPAEHLHEHAIHQSDHHIPIQQQAVQCRKACHACTTAGTWPQLHVPNFCHLSQ